MFLVIMEDSFTNSSLDHEQVMLGSGSSNA